LQRKPPFYEFLVPEALKPWDLPERFRGATFDRDLAIRRTDAEFLALGHPFVDAMLEYVGSYDFGGLTAIRHIANPKLTGRSGFLFIFVVRRRIANETADECLFQFQPVFVRSDGQIDEEAGIAGVTQKTVENFPTPKDFPPAEPAFLAARKHLENSGNIWDWADDVEFLGMSWIQFT
jgi:hypothetical protein